ncbi:MAG: hypothetical protein R2741_07475 [Methanolobus sp.]
MNNEKTKYEDLRIPCRIADGVQHSSGRIAQHQIMRRVITE